jgi:hypothetical protein
MKLHFLFRLDYLHFGYEITERSAQIAAQEARAYCSTWTLPMVDISQTHVGEEFLKDLVKIYLGSQIAKAMVNGFNRDLQKQFYFYPRKNIFAFIWCFRSGRITIPLI